MSKPPRRKPTKSPYSRQPRLITPSELRFLHTGLRPAVEERFYISTQVPLTAVLKVDDDQWHKAAGRKVRALKLDFVLVYPRTFRIAAVIELDDLSHQLDHRKRRDSFVEQALESAGVLLIRIPVYKKYDAKRIRSIIYRMIREHHHHQKA